jgi:hypothetical protein
MPLIARESLPRAARGLKGLSKPEAGTLLPIHFVVECEWSSPAHRASSGLCLFGLDEDPAVITQNGSGRRSTNGSFVGCLRDSMTDKMRGAV